MNPFRALKDHDSVERMAVALERVATCLERLLPPLYPPPAHKEGEVAGLSQATNESTYEAELQEIYENTLKMTRERRIMEAVKREHVEEET